MDEDSIRGLFSRFKSDFKRSYETDDEETSLFGIFKLNLKHIDSLNRMNPLALFGITEATDMTDNEKNARRMSAKWSNYGEMKGSLLEAVTRVAAQGPAAAAGTQFSDEDLEGSHWLQKGQVEWVTEDHCAACNMVLFEPCVCCRISTRLAERVCCVVSASRLPACYGLVSGGASSVCCPCLF